MEKNTLRLSELVARKRLGLLTETETEELEQLLDKATINRVVAGKVLQLPLSTKYKTYHAVDNPHAWAGFEKKREERERNRKRYKYLFRSIAAAVVLFAAGAGLLWTFSPSPVPDGPREPNSSDFKMATLFLPDGQEVRLTGKDTLFAGVQAEIRNTAEALRYTMVEGMDKEVLNTLETPLGGEYHVVLSDGTKVWLNAGSRLTYPENFLGEKRTVTLDGEGYFEVQHAERIPFIVHTNGMDIEVLGTKFNIKSYSPEEKTVATLINGRISAVVSGKEPLLLRPDQQAVLDVSQGKLTVHEVIARDYAAWKEGRFIFKEEGLEAVMNDIARWYDIRVVYEQDEAKQFGFTGMIDRYKDISGTLAIIEKTGKVVFEHKDNTVYVKLK